MVVSGLIVGWGINSTLLEAVAGFGLLCLLAITMIWVGTLIGVLVRSPDAVQGIAFVVGLPADLRRQHVRAGRRAARRPPSGRRIQPGQRLGGGGPDPVRQPDRDPRGRGLAARAPGGRLGRSGASRSSRSSSRSPSAPTASAPPAELDANVDGPKTQLCLSFRPINSGVWRELRPRRPPARSARPRRLSPPG